MANGFFNGGKGTTDDPYLIEDADDLNSIRKFPSSSFKLINDINLGNGKYNTGVGWKPIETFSGILNGNNHKIINLTINRPTDDNVGFIATITNYKVKIYNLTFADTNIAGKNNVGILAGLIDFPWFIEVGTYNPLTNIFCTGKLEGNSNVSGIVGHMKPYVQQIPNLGDGWYSHIFVITNLFADVRIKSMDGKAYGISYAASKTSYGNDGRGNSSTPNYDNVEYLFRFINCTSIITPDESVTTYYSIAPLTSTYSTSSNNSDYNRFEKCFTHTEPSSALSFGDTIKINLTSLDVNDQRLFGIDADYFNKNDKKRLAIKNININNIYLHYNNGFYAYDYGSSKMVRKYDVLDDNNSKEIVQNGMDGITFGQIPSSVWFDLAQEYKKIDIINCISSHNKLVYTNEIVTLKPYTEQNDKRITKKKISLDNLINLSAN